MHCLRTSQLSQGCPPPLLRRQPAHTTTNAVASQHVSCSVPVQTGQPYVIGSQVVQDTCEPKEFVSFALLVTRLSCTFSCCRTCKTILALQDDLDNMHCFSDKHSISRLAPFTDQFCTKAQALVRYKGLCRVDVPKATCCCAAGEPGNISRSG